MARIVDHLPLEALEARYRAARDATEARHYQAIWRLAQGRTVLDVAEVLAFVPRRVEELAARERLWPRGTRRPVAAQWPGGEPAERRRAGRLGRARADAAGRRWAVDRSDSGGLDRGAAVRTCLRNVAGRP